MTLSAHIDGIGVIGPGFDDWGATRRALGARGSYAAARTNLPAPEALPPSERRRASRAIKVALGVGFEACRDADRGAATLATVFSASSGDGDNCHALCQQLATDDRQISPTRFHNSVHNAPAGYWGIASGAMAPSSVLCAYDASFGAGLLEALAQVRIEQRAVLMIVYDTDYPEPLRATRPVPDAFGVALVLAPEPGARTRAQIDVATTQAPATTMSDAPRERLRREFPAGRALPLLAALADEPVAHASLVVDYLPDLRLAIEVRPTGCQSMHR